MAPARILQSDAFLMFLMHHLTFMTFLLSAVAAGEEQGTWKEDGALLWNGISEISKGEPERQEQPRRPEKTLSSEVPYRKK